ncbi:MAG: transcription termination factor Rho [Solirubrobacteraceae bacterium]|jgi:transcription termination factor Rho|nr:transcription termination factor Rho [Solirubrobacteraceae bacterium]
MSVLTRSALDDSPLADLHALASTLGIDGFRRLRKPELADAILARQGGATEEDAPAPVRAPRRRRSTAAAAAVKAKDADEPAVAEPAVEEAEAALPKAPKPRAPRRSRARKVVEAEVDVKDEVAPEPETVVAAPREPAVAGEREAAVAGEREPAAEVEEDSGSEAQAAAADSNYVEGVVELLSNGSGFLRVSPPDPSDGDVYISAAQARRCELVTGDRVGGPLRRARRSERHPSLIRVATINGVAADESVSGTRLEELDADFPSTLIALGEDDPTLAAIGFYAPIGRGSRVVLAGPARSGKTEAIKRLAGVLAGIEDLEVEVLLVGVRPEELREWKESTIATVSGLTFAATADVRAAAVEQAVERARRIAARGGDAALLIDTLDGLHPPVVRRALAAARNVRDGGSLTIIGTAEQAIGGETTVVVFDQARIACGALPAIDPISSGTIRAELLVGLEGYQAIAKARSEL